MFFDLASLTKPLVTAPLALEYLDLDIDWSDRLGASDWPGPITPRHLLSHAAGMPPWMPYVGMSVFEQIEAINTWGRHRLLNKATWGKSTYSDISYRLLAEILEMETGQDWAVIGENLTGLLSAPWDERLVSMPPGADFDAWCIATTTPFPDPKPGLPHDANARAGMKGHAGFGATPESACNWLSAWLKDFCGRMAVETNLSTDGQIWGLGLQILKNGENGFAELLDNMAIQGVQVISYEGIEDPPSLPPHVPTDCSDWWFHFGYTGPAMFVRPRDLTCVLILCHRLGNKTQLLSADELRARRMEILGKSLPTAKVIKLAKRF
ncbi:MAG: beta-lactamase family protein [Holophagaceae bacterium]|nr:beta-lactamase family protein [Holophagaceae bacterium]